MNCTYCHMEIDKDEFGWGYYTEHYKRTYFHMECIEVFEDVHAV